MIKKNCEVCGKEYSIKPSQEHRSKFCSNHCATVKRNKNRTRNLIGKRFGRWTVISQSNSGSHGSRWLCRCDCGNEKVVGQNSLDSGDSKSCGCLYQEKVRSIGLFVNRKPIKIGTRFTRLVILEERGVAKGRLTYLCQCDCGKRIVTDSNSLNSGKTKSCSCYGNDFHAKRLTTHGHSGKPWYNAWRHRVRKLLDFGWTREMEIMIRELQPACVVCGSTDRLAIDHVNAMTKGNALKPGNAVRLCKRCNSWKNNRDFDKLPRDWQNKIGKAAREFKDAWDNR